MAARREYNLFEGRKKKKKGECYLNLNFVRLARIISDRSISIFYAKERTWRDEEKNLHRIFRGRAANFRHHTELSKSHWADITPVCISSCDNLIKVHVIDGFLYNFLSKIIPPCVLRIVSNFSTYFFTHYSNLPSSNNLVIST